MTVIAWDGKILAADRRCTQGDIISGAFRKIHRLSDGQCIASSGPLDRCTAVLQWYVEGADPARWPACQNGPEWVRLVVVYPNGRVQQYEQEPIPHEVSAPFMAWGSGRDIALGAMAHGATAIEAVRCASRLCATCGDGVNHFVVRA